MSVADRCRILLAQHRRGFLLQASQFIMVRQLSRVDRYWQECYRVRSSHETECEPFQRCQTTCHTTMQSFAPRHEPFGPFGPGDVNAGDCRFGPPRRPCTGCTSSDSTSHRLHRPPRHRAVTACRPGDSEMISATSRGWQVIPTSSPRSRLDSTAARSRQSSP